MASVLQRYLSKRTQGVAAGIYSVCSAHPWVIRAAAEQAAEDGSLLLIEATSNQVNQFGGYTGMRPAEFRRFVLEHVAVAGVGAERLILGGDHLGPNPWRSLPAVEAMELAEAMVADYAHAGFGKIHLDASMACAGDSERLSDEVVAQRASRLCKAAEDAVGLGARPLYVIGTEVPVPGGATQFAEELEVTSVDAATRTLAVHKRVFAEQGLSEVWSRVIAMVVQPGVEFDHDVVVKYDRKRANALVGWLRGQSDEIVFEAHSTDYQLPQGYKELVEDGFSILKVGPALTFAMREALEALEDIEVQLVAEDECSHLSGVVEETMLRDPKDWKPYYLGSPAEQRQLRRYSYSDRVRYYWHRPEVEIAVGRLVANLSRISISESMLSRYLPAQYSRLRMGEISADPAALVIDKVRDVLRMYAAACSRSME
jgi:D-tagatose-1,6-bisphosphate aldolase subunit GatZ/KbaZ